MAVGKRFATVGPRRTPYEGGGALQTPSAEHWSRLQDSCSSEPIDPSDASDPTEPNDSTDRTDPIALNASALETLTR